MPLKLPVAHFETVLTATISTTATDIGVLSGLTEDGTNLVNGQVYGLDIDEGNSREETIIGTWDNSGSQFTSCLRGVSSVDGITEVTALKKKHRRNAKIKITDHPYLIAAIRVLNGTDAFGGVPKNPSTRTISDPRHLVDLEYLQATALSSNSAFAVSQNGADPSLTINIAAGTLLVGSEVVSYAGASAQAVVANTTNYVMLDYNGVLVINQTGFLEGHIPLATVVTSLTDVTSIADNRAWLTTVGALDKIITDRFTYGATIAAGNLVYIDPADGKWKVCDADTAATVNGRVAIALDAGSNLDTGKRVQVAGVVTGLSGLTPGWQFASNTAGGLSATAGTTRKMVGFAPTATTLVLAPGSAPEHLDGVDSSVTAAALNAVTPFFTAPYTQNIRTTIAAGEDLAQGDLVSIHSDGEVYRAGPTGFGTAASATTASDEFGEYNYPGFFFPTTSALKFTFVQKINGGNYSFITFTLGAALDTIASVGSAQPIGNPSSGGNCDIVMPTAGVIVSAYTNGAALSTQCSNDYEGSNAAGSAVALEAANATGAAICDTSVATTHVAFTYIDTTEIRSYKITRIAQALTESTNAAFLSSATTKAPGCARRFTGTNNIMVAYVDGSGALSVIAGTYVPASGTWSAVGSAVQLEASGCDRTQVNIHIISATKAIVVYKNGSDVKAQIITAATLVLTAAASTTLISGGAANTSIASSLIGSYGLFVSGAYNGAPPKSAMWRIDRDYTAFVSLGTYTGSYNGGMVMNGMISTEKALRVERLASGGAADYGYNLLTLANNFDAILGFADAVTEDSATANVITQGYTDDLAGLTAGTVYHPSPFGKLTSTVPLHAATKSKVAVKALSATTGVVKT